MTCACSTRTAGCWRPGGSPMGWPGWGSCTCWWPPMPRTRRRWRSGSRPTGACWSGRCWPPATRCMRSTRRWSAATAAATSSRAKSDRGDAKVLADLVRTDRHNHRQVAGDSPLVEAVKVLARAHQNLIWARQRHVNALRSALREFYPGALAALGAQLASPRPWPYCAGTDPGAGPAAHPGGGAAGACQAGRRRNLQARVVAVHDALAAPQLAAPEPVEARLPRGGGCPGGHTPLPERSRSPRWSSSSPPGSPPIRTRRSCAACPGSGWCWGRGCWASSATTRTAIRRPRAARPSPAPPQSPDPPGSARWWLPERRAISGWWMPATCGRSRPSPPRRAPGAAMTPTGSRRHPSSGAASAREPAGRRPARLPGPPGRLPGADRLAGRGPPPEHRSGGAGGGNPPAYWPPVARGPWSGWGSDAARSRRGAKEVGLLSGRRRRRLKGPTCFGGAP